MQLAQVGGLKADVFQAGNALAKALGAWRQGAHVSTHRVGLQVGVSNLLEPHVLVGGKHAIGPARLRHHLAALKHHMVLEGLEADAEFGQTTPHLMVAGQGLGLVVVVGKHRLHPERLGQASDFLSRRAMAHDQASPGLCTQGVQLGVERHQRLADELHPPVGTGQGRQNVAVKHKDRMHLGAA